MSKEKTKASDCGLSSIMQESDSERAVCLTCDKLGHKCLTCENIEAYRRVLNRQIDV